ncbi:hypothetical protein [Thermobispora bispora]|uniref:hypothetical protein n=1 Tax=Thermobispora bispora TaxID=2006 RepID=UPI001A7EC097|nr:hypothetical protein [Thermobispora bispora]
MTELAELAGYDLGRRTVSYTDSDAILYALCVGAKASELELVYERDLKVLPTFGLGLGLWAVEKAGNLGVYDRLRSLHAAQILTVHEAFAPSGTLDMRERLGQGQGRDGGHSRGVRPVHRGVFDLPARSRWLGWGPRPVGAAPYGR